MMKRLRSAPLPLIFLCFTIVTGQPQETKGLTKPTAKLEDFDFDQEEMKAIRKNGVTTYSDLQKKESGLADCQTVRYDFYKKPEGAFTQLLFVSILIFSDQASLEKKMNTLDGEDIFTPCRNHTFLIGTNTLVYFYLGAYRIGDKDGSEMYLQLLEHYRQRLNAKLVLPPKSGFTEKSYFEKWSSDIKQ